MQAMKTMAAYFRARSSESRNCCLILFTMLPESSSTILKILLILSNWRRQDLIRTHVLSAISSRSFLCLELSFLPWKCFMRGITNILCFFRFNDYILTQKFTYNRVINRVVSKRYQFVNVFVCLRHQFFTHFSISSFLVCGSSWNEGCSFNFKGDQRIFSSKEYVL